MVPDGFVVEFKRKIFGQFFFNLSVGILPMHHHVLALNGGLLNVLLVDFILASNPSLAVVFGQTLLKKLRRSEN